jgi:hypothetical protein
MATDWNPIGGRNEGMSDPEFKYPEWQRPLQDVILEFDREQLTCKIEKIEALILKRLQQLGQGSDGHGEREAISHALSILRAIKRDKLDFPDWE